MNGLLRYAPRHFLDQLITRGAVMVVIGFVLILPMSLAQEASATSEQMVGLLREMLTTVGLFYTMIASYGLAGGDVRQGFYRFLFAKPISPVVYYSMSYVVTTAVFAFAILATIGLNALMIHPIWPGWPLLGDVFVDYLLISALILVFSRLSNADWIFGPVILGVASVVRSRFPADDSLHGKVLDVLLPPTGTSRFFPFDGGVNWEPLLVQLTYAVIMFALAMLIVRKLSMGSAH
jgi:fumarate reductase subunit D